MQLDALSSTSFGAAQLGMLTMQSPVPSASQNCPEEDLLDRLSGHLLTGPHN